MDIPFKKFVKCEIYAGGKIQAICTSLSKKHFNVYPDDVSEVYNDVLSTASPRLLKKIKDGESLSVDDKGDLELLENDGVLLQYKNNLGMLEGEKEQKWFNDIEWILKYVDVMTMVNIFIFNEEPMSEISQVILFKYKRKIGVDALNNYKNLYWDVDAISAKEAVKSFKPLKSSSYIIRYLADGDTEVEHAEFKYPEEINGFDSSFQMLTTNYIKWKLGYGSKVKAPRPRDFMEKVMLDSSMKYEEALHMSRSVEVAHDEGEGIEGPINVTRTRRRNVESERSKLMKNYMDMYIRANESIPDETDEEEANFFKNLQQINMEFISKEKIIDINDRDDILLDIKEDTH